MSLLAPIAAQASNVLNLEEMNSYSRRKSKPKKFDSKTFINKVNNDTANLKGSKDASEVNLQKLEAGGFSDTTTLDGKVILAAGAVQGANELPSTATADGTNEKVEVPKEVIRKELVYVEYDRKNYVQAPTILQLFTGIKFNYHKLFLHYGYFDLWAIWYRQLFVIVPFLIMAPGLFTAAFTLGVMMQVVNAFGEVKDAFSVFLYNWTRITELRSIYKRLMEFETAINYNKNTLRKPRKSDVRV